MKYLTKTSLLIICILCGCRKSENKIVAPTHTAGISGTRTWHVYKKALLQHPITTDSIAYEATDTQLADVTFALTASGADTLIFNNERYGYTNTDGGYLYFPIWHHKYSGNKSVIRYNADSNTVMIYKSELHIYSKGETWYYSF